jgi:hypothetical protein
MKLLKNKPRWEIEDAVRRGERAYGLLTGEDRATLEARGLAGTAEGFRLDLDAMAEASVRAVRDLLAQKGATGGKLDAAQDGHDFVMVVRETVERVAPKDLELHRTIGVGDGVKANEPDRVLAALDQIVELGGENADGLVPSGVSAACVQEAAELAAALRTKKRAKDDKVVARASGTEARTALHLRVESTVDQVGTTGMAAFRKDPVKRARYEALFASPGPEAAAPAPSQPADPTGADPPALLVPSEA